MPDTEKKLGERADDISWDTSDKTSTKTKEVLSDDVSTEDYAKEETKSGSAFLMAFSVVAFLIVGGFYGVLFWGLVSNNVESNPLFEALGIESSGLQSLLITLTNGIFGFLAFLFLISTLVAIFRWFILPKTSMKRSGVLIKSFVYLFLFLLSTGLWFSLYYFITQLQVEVATSDIDKTMIQSNPSEVLSLSAPILIEFDISENLYEKIDPERIVQINWDFEGDGVVDASGAEVTHNFANRGINNGRFDVTAEIFYKAGDGSETSFKSIKEVVIDNVSVIPVITTEVDVGSVPFDVVFSAEDSFDPDGQVTMYEWDLDDDGEFEIKGRDKSTIEDTFAKVGEYTVHLRVTGTNALDTAVTKKVITVNTPPSDLKAEISTQDPLTGFVPLRIEFDGSNSFVKEGKIMKYEWLVEGELEPVPNRKLRRVFREAGEYKVTLTVENDLGERQQDDVTIVVLDQETDPVVAIRTTPEKLANEETLKGRVPFQVTFDSSDSVVSNAVEWRWDFENDGVIDDFAQVTQHIFREPGVYPVKLEILDTNDRIFEKILQVEVGASGTTAVISTTPAAGPAPLKVTFDGSGSRTDNGEIVNYIWTFPGRDPISYGAQIDYIFKDVGTYQVGLEVLTSKGIVAQDQTVVSSRAPLLQANFSATPLAGTGPLTVSISPKITAGIIQEYRWDFGDGTVERYFRPTLIEHVYQEPGTYELKLQVTDRSGLSAEEIKTIIVQ